MLIVLAVLSASAPAGSRVALVIGNASYAHAQVLANPLNDAADIGAALGRLGFSVTRIENTDYAALRRGLQKFTRTAAGSELAVVFYAGHGIEVDQRNFLVPVDARLASDQDVEFEAVPLELVQRAVERASGLRLVVLDACRENPFAVQMQRTGATRSIGRGLARVEPSGETLIAYAAKEGTVAEDGSGDRNSPYSKALLAHLEEPGLELGRMFRKVRDAVLASTGGRQEPFVYGSLSSKDVYLAQAPVSGTVAPAVPAPVVALGAAQVTAEQLAAERVFWESVKESGHPADIEAYLQRYPGGTFEVLAKNRLDRLEGAAKPSSSPASDVPATPTQVAIMGTWKAKNRGWTIKLRMFGDHMYAIVSHPAAIGGPARCRGKVGNAGEINTKCFGFNHNRPKLVGTFPNLKLLTHSDGTLGGASFAFELDKESQEIN